MVRLYYLEYNRTLVKYELYILNELMRHRELCVMFTNIEYIFLQAAVSSETGATANTLREIPSLTAKLR